MAKQLINLGTPNGRDGDTVRVAFGKINDNFSELYVGLDLLNIGSNVRPATSGIHDLGGIDRKWHSLWLDIEGVHIGANRLSVNEQGAVTVNGDVVATPNGDPVQADWLATSGPSKILNKPVLSAVATSNDYRQLSHKPTIPTLTSQLDNDAGYTTFSGSWTDLTNKPTLFNGSYLSLTNRPTLFSGSYLDLVHRPTLFTGSYLDLTNKPAIPLDVNQLTDVDSLLGAGGSGTSSIDWRDIGYTIGQVVYDTGTKKLYYANQTFPYGTGYPPSYPGNPYFTPFTAGNGTANRVQFANAGNIDQNEDSVETGRYNIVVNAEYDVVIQTNESEEEFRFTADGALRLPTDGTITAALSQQVGTIISNIEAWDYHNSSGDPYAWIPGETPVFQSLYNRGDEIIGWLFYSTNDPSNVRTITSRDPGGPALTFNGDLGSAPYTAHSPDYVPFHGNPVVIQTNGPQFQANWTFGQNGVLTLPNGSTIGNGDAGAGIPITTSRGTILLGNVAECAGGENHFHIMKAGQQDIDLFLGDDSNYVKLPSTGGVEISSSEIGSQHYWTFGTDGLLTFPNGTLIGSPEGSAGIFGPNGTDFLINTRFDNTGSYQAWTFGTDGVLTMPDGNLGGDGRIAFNFEGYNWGNIRSHNRQVYIESGEGITTTYSQIAVGLDMSLSSIENITLRTATTDAGDLYNDGTGHNPSFNTWTFGTDGNLTLPDGGIIKNFDGTEYGGGGTVNLGDFTFSGSTMHIPVIGGGSTSYLNAGGVGTPNSVQIRTEVNYVDTDINTSEIAIEAGNGGFSAQVTNHWTGGADGSGGPTLVYAGVENVSGANGPGFAGMVAIDPNVTSQYAIALDGSNNIIIGATQPTSDYTVTTTAYTVGIGALNKNTYNMTGLLATPDKLVLNNSNHAWNFDSDGNLTFPGTQTITDADGDLVITNPVLRAGVSIGVHNPSESPTHWYFASNGQFNLPSGAGFARGDSGQLKVNDAATLSLDIRDNSGRGFYTNNDGFSLRGNGSNTWKFGTDGSLTLPGGSAIDYTSGVSTNINVNNHKWEFDVNGNLTVPGDIKSAAGVGPVTIEANDGTLRTWTFGGDGSLTLPTNSGQSAIHSSGFITVGPTTPLEVMRIALDGHGVTIGGNSADNGLTYQRYSLGGTPIDSISTHRAGNLAEMRITADGESGGAIKLTSIGVDGYISLVSNSNEWHLGNTGDLTVPGDILGQEGNDLAVQVFNPDAQGGVSFVVQNRQVDLDNNRTTQFEVTPQDIKLTTDFSGNKNEWTFGADGTIQFPVLSILDLPSPVAGLKAFVNNADNFVPWGTDVSTLGPTGNITLPVWSDGYGWYVG
jgi:hypothetical protein